MADDRDDARTSARAGLVLALAIAAAVLAAVGFSRRSPAPATSEPSRLLVVTTTPVLFSLAANVVGDFAELQNLLPPGSSPHTYALRPADAEALARADVAIENGLGLEVFLNQALAHLPAPARRITASTGVATLTAPRHTDEGVGARDREEERGSPDPHIWLDPQRATQMVENIADGLVQADPTHAGAYRENARRYADRLGQLDEEFARALAPTPRKDFIAFHPAWTYFADRYELVHVAAIEDIPGEEPTARERADLASRIRATGVRALLNEPRESSRIVEAVARDTGLTVFLVDPEGVPLAATGYEDLMRANVATFVRALSER